MMATTGKEGKMTAQNKGCARCGVWMPLEEFHRRSAAPDGRRNTCKACVREYQQRYSAKRREEAQKPPPSWAAPIGQAVANGGGSGGRRPPAYTEGSGWWVAYWATIDIEAARHATAQKLGVPVSAIEAKRTGGAVLARIAVGG